MLQVKQQQLRLNNANHKQYKAHNIHIKMQQLNRLTIANEFASTNNTYRVELVTQLRT